MSEADKAKQELEGLEIDRFVDRVQRLNAAFAVLSATAKNLAATFARFSLLG